MKHLHRFVFILVLSIAAGGYLIGCKAGSGHMHGDSNPHPPDEVPRKLTAEQDGGEAYWLLPGPRVLSPKVFGTPGNPKRLVGPKIKKA